VRDEMIRGLKLGRRSKKMAEEEKTRGGDFFGRNDGGGYAAR